MLFYYEFVGCINSFGRDGPKDCLFPVPIFGVNSLCIWSVQMPMLPGSPISLVLFE